MSPLPGIIHRLIKADQRPPTLSASEAVSQQPEAVYAHFSIAVRLCEDGAADAWPASSTELLAGRRYDVVITCEHSRGNANQEDVLITGDFRLRIQQCFAVTTGYAPPYQDFTVSYTNACKPRYVLPVWSVTLPEHLPTCDVTFLLHFKESHSSYIKENIAVYRLRARGDTVLEDAQALAACNIAAGLPPGAAVLAIAAENVAAPTDGIEITTINRAIGNRLITLRTSMVAGVAQLFSKTASISSILDRILLFSRDHAGELMTWLRQFMAACKEHQQSPCIIIVNTQGALEIPWELLEIDTYAYLGAIAQVVRWYPFSPYGKPKILSVKKVVYEGSVLAYLDQKLACVQQEHAVLNHFQREDVSDLWALRTRLRKDRALERIGLVYIACHGQEGHTLSASEQDRLQRPDRALRSLELARMPEQPEPRPIFFVNACDSARMLRDSKTNPVSFAESFLVRCASNYIGTMAPVGSRNASLIAGDILQQAMSAEGVQIAEALRVLRARVVARRCDSDQDDEAQKEVEKDFFYTFMYVYYGNPLAHLRLHTVNSAKEDA